MALSSDHFESAPKPSKAELNIVINQQENATEK